MNHLKLAENELRRFEPLDLSGALTICFYLDAQSDDIFFNGVVTTPAKLLPKIFDRYHPRSIHIKFWGGPPQRGGWHVGTFQSYIIDRLAHIIAECGLQTAKRALKIGIKSAKEKFPIITAH